MITHLKFKSAIQGQLILERVSISYPSSPLNCALFFYGDDMATTFTKEVQQ
jgi:hypothetical protein